MAKTFYEMLEGKDSERAELILDYYDGKQQKHFEKLLSSGSQGRKDWKKRGIIPRTRNLVKMIVDKSGLLFNGPAPIISVYDSKSETEPNEVATKVLLETLEQVEWIEFFTNFDATVRLLKTALVLVQYDTSKNKLVLDALSRDNSAIILNTNKELDTLVYKVGEDDEDNTLLRVITAEIFQDIKVSKKGQETIIGTYPNPYGIIPVAVFHDTNTPRAEFWNYVPEDLLQLNEMYNLHITDSEYAASWSKLKTLFTNADIVSENTSLEVVQPYNSLLPRQMQMDNSDLIGGPARVIKLDTSGVDSPFVEYKGPEVDLLPIDEMFNKWVSDFAGDWSVNIKFGGNGSADSGFKLIVEEMPNLELRKKRAKMFSAGFNRLFQVIKTVLRTNGFNFFSETSISFTEFYPPALPVDEQKEEEIWSKRIAEGRASRLDYFMSKGMTKSEAEEKIKEIDSVRDLSIPRTVAVTKVTNG
jgi:hypothetical protein